MNMNTFKTTLDGSNIWHFNLLSHCQSKYVGQNTLEVVTNLSHYPGSFTHAFNKSRTGWIWICNFPRNRKFHDDPSWCTTQWWKYWKNQLYPTWMLHGRWKKFKVLSTICISQLLYGMFIKPYFWRKIYRKTDKVWTNPLHVFDCTL